MKRLDHYWYSNNAISIALLPLSWLFCLIVAIRRFAYRTNLLRTTQIGVPVVVVGNISVGGTGKTPLVAEIVRQLKERGFRPGVISRGYGGNASSWPQQVRADSDPRMVGDEPLLLARRCQVPIAVGPNRVAAAEALLKHTNTNIIVSDDGMQHYALHRDIEIAVVDGVRRLGNQRCLPAGPLRERAPRLEQVDLVVANGGGVRGEFAMRLIGNTLVAVDGRNGERALESFKGVKVHAVAAIGDPQRFFNLLRRHGVELIEHPFPDHHPFSAEDIAFNDNLPVLMTEKDAVKCRPYAAANHWYLPVSAELNDSFHHRLMRLLPSDNDK